MKGLRSVLRMTQSVCFSTLLAFLIAFTCATAPAQSGLVVNYSASGVQTLSYNGFVLEDLNANPSDAFHIWHMKVTDLNGNVIGQDGWGEQNNGRSWNADTRTWTYSFAWGTIAVQFVQNGDALDMNVTATNYGSSNVVFDGATIYPFGLHFPQLPAGFYDPSYAQFAFNTTGPSVTVADYGMGEVVAVAPDATRPLYSGFQPTGDGIAYTPIISGTSPDSLATFQPHNDRPLLPGQTDSYTVSLRFAASGAATSSLAADAYKSWAATYPPVLNWADRRIIGTVFLASSPTGNVTQPGGYPNNPRRYFNDSNQNDFDVTTASGLAAFQARVLAQASTNVNNLKQLNAQGSITWDIEGEQYPQDTSYVCSPDQIAQVSPEMESTIGDSLSPYTGMKLDDAYFKIMTDAGLRVGVCIRPQHFTLNGDGTAQQVFLSNANVAGEMIRKMQYAHDRWGATLFYVDSTVEADGAVLDALLFKQAAAALPDSLLIPEESTPLYYAYTAPFKSFLFLGDLGTNATVYNYYPNAFSANLINDVDPGKLSSAAQLLTQQVKNGDILLAHADYWQDNNPTIIQIYQSAGVWSPPIVVVPPSLPVTPPVSTPITPPSPIVPIVPVVPVLPVVPVVPVAPNLPATLGPLSIVSPASGQAVSAMLTVTGQVDLNLDAAGTFLMVDGVEVGTKRVTGSPYLYSFDTTTVTNGTHVLQLWGHDITNTTTLSAPVVITVAN